MPDGTYDFGKFLSTISATMASLSLVGVSIILTIFYKVGLEIWKTVAYWGAFAAFLFAGASILAFMVTHPLTRISKRSKKLVLNLATSAFFLGWLLFFITITMLVVAVRTS